MSNGLRAAWQTVIGLVVEDSQLAIGIVAALVITWALSTAGDTVEPIIGWLLLALLIAVLLGNLLVTARRAKRRMA
jgi:hypothetical protein